MATLVRFNITPDSTGEIKVNFSTKDIDTSSNSTTYPSATFIGTAGAYKTGDAELLICDAGKTFIVNKKMYENESANLTTEDTISDGSGTGTYKLYYKDNNFIITGKVKPSRVEATPETILLASDMSLFNADLNGYALLGQIDCGAGRSSVSLPICVFPNLDTTTSGLTTNYGELCFETNWTSGRNFRIFGNKVVSNSRGALSWWNYFADTAKTYTPTIGIVPGANVIIEQFRDEVATLVDDLRQEGDELTEELHAEQTALINKVRNTYISR